MASSAIPAASSFRLSSAMERTGQWVLSQEVPTDLVVQVGETCVPLHRFMLVAKSGYIRRKVLESAAASASDQVTHLDLSPIPGGADALDRAARFCYGVNFEISVHNVAALRCAAEFLEMTDKYCDGNLASRTEEFLSKAALRTLSGAIAVLKSCEELVPAADELRIVQRCVDAVSLKACNESNFPTRSPPEWWASELTGLAPFSLQKILAAMKARGASPRALGAVISAYADKSLPLSGAGPPSALAASDLRSRVETIAGLLLPAAGKDAALPVGFLCRLLRSAIFLEASAGCRKELEKRISAVLGEATVGDLLTVAFDYSGERVADLESVRRIVAEFSEREMGGIMGGFFGGGASAEVQRVARVLDAFVGEIATDVELSVSKFAGIAGALPKAARRSDDDLYRAVDIYLKAHPELDEIEREKVCSVMDPLRLSYEARLHASQNKRLPLQIVLHALYYDQLKLRSGAAAAGDDQPPLSAAASARRAAAADSSLMRENEALRSELSKMKLYLSDLQKTGGGGGGGVGTPGSSRGTKKSSSFGLFSSVSRTLGKLKLNPFKGASKDTSTIDDEAVAAVEVTKPKRRRFSIS